MKICVVGAGAVGGLFLAWLSRASAAQGLQVSALARGATLAALREHGLQFVDTNGTSHITAVRACATAAELGPQDLVVLTVKSPALPSLATTVAELLAPGGLVLQAMNGLPWWFAEQLPGRAQGLQLRSVDPAGALASHIASTSVIGCVVHLGASQTAPAAVRHHNGNSLILGEPAGGGSERVQRLAALLQEAGFAVTVSERIQRNIWFKLWGNMTMNPVSAITGATLDRILDDPLVRAWCNSVMLEARDVGAAIGLAFDQHPEERHAMTRELGAFKTSMLQDVEAGRAIELDALVGAVREIGQHLGLATPNIDALMGLTRLLAQSRGLYPMGTAPVPA